MFFLARDGPPGVHYNPSRRRENVSEPLYTTGQLADRAFLLRTGEIEYWITDKDTVTLSGSNIIVGASELLIAINRKEAVPRHASLVLPGPATQLSPIPAAKLASYITNWTIGFSVAHHIAETITKLHPLLAEKMNRLAETERFSRDLARSFVETLQLLEESSGNRQFPWLVSIMDKGKVTEAYNFGLSIRDVVEEKKIDVTSEKLAQYKQVYLKETVICKEGEKAEDMFILMEGKIEVRIKNNPIDIISRKGTIIGEMGLILAQPRTATLRALEKTHVIRINAKDMASIFKNDPGTFFNMISSLAFRERIICEKIREYNEKIEMAAQGRGEYTVAQVDGYAREYAALVTDIHSAMQAHPEMDWLGQVSELVQRKATSLLSQVGTLTGEVYTIQERARSEERVVTRTSNRPVRDESMPHIDWF